MPAAENRRDLWTAAAGTALVTLVGGLSMSQPGASPLWIGLYVALLLECGYLFASLFGLAVTVPATPKAILREIATVLLVGSVLGLIVGRVWQGVSGCLATEGPGRPFGACGFGALLLGIPALAVFAVGLLVALRVKIGAGIGLAAVPTGDTAVSVYRAATDGSVAPALPAVAMLAAAAGLLAWAAVSPRLPPTARMIAIVATVALMPAALIAA